MACFLMWVNLLAAFAAVCPHHHHHALICMCDDVATERHAHCHRHGLSHTHNVPADRCDGSCALYILACMPDDDPQHQWTASADDHPGGTVLFVGDMPEHKPFIWLGCTRYKARLHTVALVRGWTQRVDTLRAPPYCFV